MTHTKVAHHESKRLSYTVFAHSAVCPGALSQESAPSPSAFTPRAARFSGPLEMRSMFGGPLGDCSARVPRSSKVRIGVASGAIPVSRLPPCNAFTALCWQVSLDASLAGVAFPTRSLVLAWPVLVATIHSATAAVG